MKNKLVILLSVLITFAIFGVDFIKYGNKVSLDKIKTRYGIKKFDPIRFKAGSAEQKAAMSYDLIKHHYLVGKTIEEVVVALGFPDGHYFSDFFPAYIIQEGWKNNASKYGNVTWQLVFVANDKRVITDIIIDQQSSPPD